MEKSISKKAYAKVNLSLDIVGRREDGYHLVRMVMQSLGIADDLVFERLDTPKIEVLLNGNVGDGSEMNSEATSGDKNLGRVPLDEDNLIYKVARLMLEQHVWKRQPDAGVRITLTKNIPIAAGMAGGSSDAAATFRGMNELFELGLLDQDLMEMGVALGADIPYCIMGGTALSEGIGEELTRLPDLPDCYFLVAKPPISVSTGEAYGGYDRLISELEEMEEGSARRKVKSPDVDGQVDAIYSGNLQGVADRFLNVLEYVTAENHPEIKELERIILEGGAINSMMSGSGPTVFGIYDSLEAAEASYRKIVDEKKANQVFITKAV
ncbi:MAG: 4-(cytidine 5'-diphospho)-2-C-methyl-D-erythritol kinase [Eubacterium sp.]|nr:4-(cytidine 5'-diphospho)-2-C-methyl-D-erythritol kinase [Eubacterium sp.]